MIKPSDKKFNHSAIVAGWNARRRKDAYEAQGVLVLGEKTDEPGAFAVLWALYDADTGQIIPMRLDCTEGLLRDLEAGAVSAAP